MGRVALALVQALTSAVPIPAAAGFPRDTVAPLVAHGSAWSESIAAASHSLLVSLPDTAKQSKSFEYSAGYGVRQDIHRISSYFTMPLILVQYLSGEELLQKGSQAPSWAQDIHRPAAIALGSVFLVNTVTGVWNAREARHDPEGRTRRSIHGVLMLLADAGFVYAAAVAPSLEDIDHRIASGQRGGWTEHKKAAMLSMASATAGYLMMYIWKD
jgi:hypothetical protein